MRLAERLVRASRRRGRGVLILILLLPFAACGYPQIRVKNDSPYRLDGIRVHCDTVVRDFGSLAPGEATAYTTVGEAAEWQRVEATLADGKAVAFEPSGSPGRLSPGFYTYHLMVDDVAGGEGSQRLNLHLTQDAYPPD